MILKARLQSLMSSFLNKSIDEATLGQDEIVVVVLGDAETKGDAVETALLTAVEQMCSQLSSYSAPITELFDDMDVRVSLGSVVRGYSEISRAKLSGGTTVVALKAIISIGRLVDYAKGKGMAIDFSGADFELNLKKTEMEKFNEMAALNALTALVKKAMPLLFQPRLSVVPEEVDEGMFRLTTNIDFVEHTAAEAFSGLLNNVLKEIALSDKATRNGHGMGEHNGRLIVKDNTADLQQGAKLWFRNGRAAIQRWKNNFGKALSEGFADYVVVDNLGHSSSFGAITEDVTHGFRLAEKVNGTFFFAKGNPRFVFSKSDLMAKLLEHYKTDDDIYVRLPRHEMSRTDKNESHAAWSKYRIKIVSLLPEGDVRQYTSFTIVKA